MIHTTTVERHNYNFEKIIWSGTSNYFSANSQNITLKILISTIFHLHFVLFHFRCIIILESSNEDNSSLYKEKDNGVLIWQQQGLMIKSGAQTL